MPIVIYSEGKSGERLASLCAEEWELPKLVPVLESWLAENHPRIKRGRYVADIGFAVREDAGGGGSALSPESMRLMADCGMSLFLSEYRR